MAVVNILLLIVFAYVAFSVLYLLLFSVAGCFGRRKKYESRTPKKRFLIIVPAYREDVVIIDTARNALMQHYPRELFSVLIIADKLREETIARLNEMPVKTQEVHFEKSTKAKSIKTVLKDIPGDEYDLIVVLDADNIMDDHCLEKMNHAFHKGFRMVQLHRTAKNKHTSFAFLDAVSEEINNHIFRQGHRSLGISAAVIGSGMGFEFPYFRDLMLNNDIEDNPGEDSEIELIALKDGLVCEYIEDAFVYDEKIPGSEVMERQRTRWLSAHLHYLKRFWWDDIGQLLKHNIHYFDKVVQTAILPRSLLLLVIFFFAALSLALHFIFHIRLFPGWGSWTILCLAGVFAIGLAIPRKFYNRDLLKAFGSLPKGIWTMVRALSKSKTNQKEFIHTPKTFVD